MAIKPSDEYPGKTVAPSAEYPQGSAQNITTPGDGTGTPLLASWLNDLWGFLQSLLNADGTTPTGSPDEVGASQYFDALPIAIEPANNFGLFDRWNADRIQYIANQGASLSLPELTIPAIKASKGMEGIFLEARLTSDSEWVLMKDDTVDRTTDGTGTVVSKTLAQIQALDAGTWKNAYFADTRVPTVEEAVLAARKAGLHPIVQAQIVASDANRQKLIDACKKYCDGYEFTISVDAGVDEVAELQAYRLLDKRVNLMLPIAISIAQGLIDMATIQPAIALLTASSTTAANVKEYHDANFRTVGTAIGGILKENIEETLVKGFGGIIDNGAVAGVEL